MAAEPSSSDREQDIPEQPASPTDELGARVVVDVGRSLWESETVPEFLWHYTDGAGALGILQGRALWATHVLFMNDASELRLAYPLLEEALRIAEQRQEGNELHQLVAAALAVMVSPTAQERDPEIYAVCFCEDGDLLSQWRGYGMAGTGYSLGVDGRSLQRSGMTTNGLSLSRVIYDVDRQRQLAQELVDGTIAVLEKHLERHSDDFDTAVPVVARNFGYLAQNFAYPIKDAAFSEEREWRLSYARAPKGSVPAAERRFRSGGRGLIPYVSIPMGIPVASDERIGPLRMDLALEDLPVRKVRVGATAHPEIARLAMSYLLSDLDDGEVDVALSMIPLRA